MKNDPALLKKTTKDVEIEHFKYKTETHYHENLLKSPKLDNEYYRKMDRSFEKKRKYF